MACPSCSPGPEECTTVYKQLNPCRCDSPGGIEETGPDGTTGPQGETPRYSIGTVESGGAQLTVVSTGYATRVINAILPAVPEGVPYTWTEQNTFTRPSIFQQGLDTTGGSTTIGGISLTVTSDATFSADVHAVGDGVIEGDVDITTHLNEDAQLTVQGDTDFQDLEFFLQTNLEDATLAVPDLSDYVRSTLVLGSCLNPEGQPNVGTGTFTKASATGLTPVGPVDSAAICNPVVIAIPVSGCMPQVTPVCDIRFRIGYRFTSAGSLGLAGNFNATLWQGGIGTTQLDFYTQGDGVWNATAGFIELRGKATLVSGNNNFVVEVANNDASNDFTPDTVTFYLEN